MIWIAIAMVVSVVILCETIEQCVNIKYEEQEDCCDSCPMQNECEAIRNGRR